MTDLISNASSTFADNLGFSWSSVVDYMLINLKLVIGTGLGVLTSLLPTIVGIVFIGAVVYFVYRAFRFFRH